MLVVRVPQTRWVLVLAVGCVGLWLALEVCVRRLVAARPAASDPQSLAFDDALRASSLRSLLPVTSSLLLLAALAWTSPSLPEGVGSVLLLCYVASLAPQLWASASARARRHYRQRLWPSPVR